MRKSRSRTWRLGAGLTTAALAAAVLVAPTTASAAPLTSITPTAGPPGARVTATMTGAFANATAIGVLLNTTGTCPGTYIASTTAFAATTPAKTDANTVTFTVPTTLALGTGNATRAYTVCVYNGTAAASALQHDTTGNPTFTLAPPVTLSPASGASGGGNTVTATAGAGTTIPASPGALFTTGSCPTAYSTAGITATATRTSTAIASVTVPSGVVGTGPTASPYTLCIYAGTVNNSSALVAVSGTNYAVSLPALTPSTTNLAATTANNLTAQSTANFLTASTAPAVVFTPNTTCPASAGAADTAGNDEVATNVRKLANNRLSASVTGLTLVDTPTTAYLMCVYLNNTTGALLSAATVSVAAVQTVTGVSPNAGPTLGGSPITITGTNFPATGLTATLGGAPLTDLVRVNDTTLTAVTPARPQGSAALVVTSPAGTSAPYSGFTYRNAIRITPNTAPNDPGTGTVWVDVLGVGFQGIGTFGSASGNARVWLVDATAGGYNPTATNTTDYTVGPRAECTQVQVIADNELICGLNLETGALNPATAAALTQPVPDGTYTLTVVSNGDVGAQTGNTYTQTVVSSGATFTVADF